MSKVGVEIESITRQLGIAKVKFSFCNVTFTAGFDPVTNEPIQISNWERITTRVFTYPALFSDEQIRDNLKSISINFGEPL